MHSSLESTRSQGVNGWREVLRDIAEDAQVLLHAERVGNRDKQGVRLLHCVILLKLPDDGLRLSDEALPETGDGTSKDADAFLCLERRGAEQGPVTVGDDRQDAAHDGDAGHTSMARAIPGAVEAQCFRADRDLDPLRQRVGCGQVVAGLVVAEGEEPQILIPPSETPRSGSASRRGVLFGERSLRRG